MGWVLAYKLSWTVWDPIVEFRLRSPGHWLEGFTKYGSRFHDCPPTPARIPNLGGASLGWTFATSSCDPYDSPTSALQNLSGAAPAISATSSSPSSATNRSPKLPLRVYKNKHIIITVEATENDVHNNPYCSPFVQSLIIYIVVFFIASPEPHLNPKTHTS